MTKQWSCALIIALCFATQSAGMSNSCPAVIRNASLHACPATRSSLLLLGVIAIVTTIGYYSESDPLPEVNRHTHLAPNQTNSIIPELHPILNELNQTKMPWLKKKFQHKNKS